LGKRGRSKALVVDPSVAVQNLRAADRRWERTPPAIQSGAHRAIELDQESFGNKARRIADLNKTRRRHASGKLT